jgi:hypothetical protein
MRLTADSNEVFVGYHGTRKPFESFKPNYNPREQVGLGIHFAEDESFADNYAYDDNVARKGKDPRVYKAQVKAKKWLDLEKIVEGGTPEFELAKKLAGRKLFTQRNEEGKQMAYLQGAFNMTSPKRAEKIILEAGYDGLIYNALITQPQVGGYTKGPQSRTFVVLDPSQVDVQGISKR